MFVWPSFRFYITHGGFYLALYRDHGLQMTRQKNVQMVIGCINVLTWTPSRIYTEVCASTSSLSIFIFRFVPPLSPLPLPRCPFFLSGRNSRHSNREPTVKWKKRVSEREKEGEKEEGGTRFKSALCPPLPQNICISLHICVSFSFCLHIYWFPRASPGTIISSFHLSLHLLSVILHLHCELRANYTFWLWETWFMIHTTRLPPVCVWVCWSNKTPPPLWTGKDVILARGKKCLLVVLFIYFLFEMLRGWFEAENQRQAGCLAL